MNDFDEIEERTPTILVIIIITLGIVAISAGLYYLKLISERQNPDFILLKDVAKGDIITKNDEFYVQMNPDSNSIYIIDFIANRLFKFYDQEMLVTKNFYVDDKVNMKKELKRNSVNYKKYDYAYINDNIAILMKTTGESYLCLQDTSKFKKGVLQLVDTGIVYNIQSNIEEYMKVKAEYPEDYIYFTINLEICRIDKDERAFYITKNGEELYSGSLEAEALNEMSDLDLMNSLSRATAYNKAVFADLATDFAIPINDYVTIGLGKKGEVKVYDESLSAYIYIRTKMFKDKNGQVSLE